MKHLYKVFALAATMLLSGSAFAGGGVETEGIFGTLPLRLPNDGTLPLRLTGHAVDMGGQLPSLTTAITITRAVQAPMPLEQLGTLACRTPDTNISKHVAAGTVKVGALTYTIKGICYDHVTKSMEVVSERLVNSATVERSFMIGLLPADEPQAFQGRLVIAADASVDAASTSRFTFNTDRVAAGLE